MAVAGVEYLVFDVESVADAELVGRIRYPRESVEPAEAVRRYRAELMEKYASDFVPYTFQIPISVAVAKVSAEFQLIDLVLLDEPEFRPHVITEKFWRGWEAYRRPILVSFNGRAFDIPLLELAAFRFGISVPGWFNVAGRSYEQPRARYNTQAHLDLCEMLTNFGSTRFTGGLSLTANILGKPGKMDVQGDMVQDMHDAGRLAEINDYCRCDVLDTYFIFLRTRVMVGQLSLDAEQSVIARTKQWLQHNAPQVRAYQLYLEHWGDWPNPWDPPRLGEPADKASLWPDFEIPLVANHDGKRDRPDPQPLRQRGTVERRHVLRCTQGGKDPLLGWFDGYGLRW